MTEANGTGASTKQENPWRPVTHETPCKRCFAIDSCRVNSRENVIACRNQAEGATETKVSDLDGLTYHLYTGRDLANARQALMTAQVEEIRQTIELIRRDDPTAVFEVRIFGIHEEHRRPYDAAGYYTDAAKAARDVVDLEWKHGVEATYITVNRPMSACLARSPNLITKYLETTSSDNDIERRVWLYIDCDPIRPRGVSATDAMLASAERLADDTLCILREEHGWPEPVRGLSGNGHYLLYAVDLPGDKADPTIKPLLGNVLHALNIKTGGIFVPDGTPPVKVDETGFNAGRVMRLLGTTNRKGYNTVEQPHRRSCVLSVPPVLESVTREQLEEVAAVAVEEKAKAKSSTKKASEAPHAKGDTFKGKATGDFSKFKLADWLKDKSQSYDKRTTADGADGYQIVCPFDSSHNGTDTMFWQYAGGAWGFKCLHDSCREKTKEEAVEAIGKPDPEKHYDPPLTGFKRRDSDNAAGQGKTGEKTAPAFDLELIDSAAFAAGDYRQDWLVKRLIVEGEPCLLGGPKKVLKTNTAVDLVVSIGSGTPFLGWEEFRVWKARRVMFLSGESGRRTIQETARRICVTKGLDLAKLNVHWGFKLPQLSNEEHLAVLEHELKQQGAEVVVVDPLYLSLLAGATAAGKSAANLFDMGPLLMNIAQICLGVNATPILLHHTRKNLAAPNEPLDLEDLAFAGVAEFARQWLLINRREPYDAARPGSHRLWMGAGGSAGFGGLWGLDIEEGAIDDDFSGRRWEVAVSPAASVREAKADARATAADERGTRKIRQDGTRILGILDQKDPGGCGYPRTKLRDLSGVSGAHFTRALESLIEEGVVVEIEQPAPVGAKGPKVLSAIRRRLPDETPDTPDTPDETPDSSGVPPSNVRGVPESDTPDTPDMGYGGKPEYESPEQTSPATSATRHTQDTPDSSGADRLRQYDAAAHPKRSGLSGIATAPKRNQP